MKTIYYEQLGNVVELRVPEIYFDLLIVSDFSRKYISCISCSTEIDRSSDLILECIENEDFKFEFKEEEKRAFLYGRFDRIIPSIQAVIVIVDYLLEYLNGIKERYTIHGSAFSVNAKGVLLLGQMSGIGKTTLCLNMCLSGKSKFIGDDKVLVGRNGILGGVKKISFNKIELSKSVPTDISNLEQDQLSKHIELENSVIPIDLIIFPIINSSVKKLYAREISKSDLSFTLFEEYSRKIRGISKRIADLYPLDSVDNQKIALIRSNHVNDLTSKTKAFYLVGNVEQTGQFIEENLV